MGVLVCFQTPEPTIVPSVEVKDSEVKMAGGRWDYVVGLVVSSDVIVLYC